MNEGAVTLTVDGVIAYCNRRFAAIVEAPLARVLGMPFRRFVPRAGHRSLAALLEGGSRAGIRSELTLRSWTGTPVPASVSFAPLQLEPGAAVSGVIGVIADISERKRAQASHSQLVQQVLTAQEEERRRVARELHDETGQSLTALLVGLRTIEGSRTIADASRLAKQLREVAAQTLLDVGRLSRGLHPSILDDMGLGAAVTRHAQEFARVHGISVESRIEGFDANRLPLLVQTTVYRVLQEALTNVAKHAEARSTSIHLVRDETAVELRVQDDGAGFAPAPGRAPVEQRRRLGLQGMRERAALLGGSIRVESSPGRGATITARFPLDGAVMPGSERSPAAPGRGQ
jgi:signal transduction histidine kinase